MSLLESIKEELKNQKIKDIKGIRVFLRTYFTENKLSLNEIDSIFRYTKNGTDGLTLIDKPYVSGNTILRCFLTKNTIKFFENWTETEISCRREYLYLHLRHQDGKPLPIEFGKYYIKDIISGLHLHLYRGELEYILKFEEYLAFNFEQLFSPDLARSLEKYGYGPGFHFFCIVGNGINISLSVLEKYLNNNMENILINDLKFFVDPILNYWSKRRLIRYHYKSRLYKVNLVREYIKKMRNMPDGIKLLLEIAV